MQLPVEWVLLIPSMRMKVFLPIPRVILWSSPKQRAMHLIEVNPRLASLSARALSSRALRRLLQRSAVSTPPSIGQNCPIKTSDTSASQRPGLGSYSTDFAYSAKDEVLKVLPYGRVLPNWFRNGASLP